MRRLVQYITMILGLFAGPVAALAQGAPSHAIAMHGDPALAANFTSFPYVNPDAPKGGSFTIGVIGSYDSLNPYVVRGEAVTGLRTYIYAPLMMRSMDEPFTLYPYIAEKVEMPEDRSSVTFYLNPKAEFSDKHPLRSEDVIFSWQLLKEKGWPNQRSHYSRVKKAEPVGETGVKFYFRERDRELPLLLGLMPVLPKHAINAETFDQSTLVRPIAAGPYIVKNFNAGTSVTLKRKQDWWAKDLPSTRGYFNFDELRYEFYRDGNALFEAFKKGLVDVRAEDDPVKWQNDYDFPAARKGLVKLETIETALPRPMRALVFNTRRPVFVDKRVREALLMLFDFEWMNVNLFNKGYERTQSYFHGSELSSHGTPVDALEKEYLTVAGAQLPPNLIAGSWSLPKSDASGNDRNLLRMALAKLREAGWISKGSKIVSQKDGQKLRIELMVSTREEERIGLSWKASLDRAGIDMRIRQVDSAQAERRRQSFDYDIVPWNYISSLSPGNEQMIRWGSKTADQPGSVNMAGVKSPVIDALLAKILGAKERYELVAATRALDRVLLAGAYVVPLFNLAKQHVAHWARIKLPEKHSLSGSMLETWWHEKGAL